MHLSTFDIKQRYSAIKKEGPTFSYMGQLTSVELNSVLRKIEVLLSSNYSSKGLQKKLFNLLIEIVQNIYNYLKKPALRGREVVFIVVTESGGTYKIITGNFLMTSEVAAIKSRIELVNSLSNQELVELYRGILDVGIMSNEGGAGLGFIDLARRSGRKLSYEFERIDDKFSFFTLEVSLTND